jgi:hypothetical protein
MNSDLQENSMRNQRRTARLGAVAMALAVFSSGGFSPAEAKSVTHATLKKLFPGTFAVRMDGVSATFVARSGGKLTGSSFAGSDSGRWSVRSGRLCITLNKWFDGSTRCSSVSHDGDWYRANNVRFRKI